MTTRTLDRRSAERQPARASAGRPSQFGRAVRLAKSPFGPSAATADASQLVTAAFTDPGVNEQHQATVDWGDGSAPTAATVSESGGSGTVTASHVYADAGTYTPTLTVTDDGGGVAGSAPAQATFPLAVQYVAPTFAVAGGKRGRESLSSDRGRGAGPIRAEKRTLRLSLDPRRLLPTVGVELLKHSASWSLRPGTSACQSGRSSDG